MKLKEDLAILIGDAASGIATPQFDFEETATGKVGGFVISPTFAGMSQIERQNMLWDYLDKNLSEQKRIGIVALLTVTPDEAEEE